MSVHVRKLRIHARIIVFKQKLQQEVRGNVLQDMKVVVAITQSRSVYSRTHTNSALSEVEGGSGWEP